jgi:hypothetical protein
MTATRSAPPGLGHVPYSSAEDWWRPWLVRTSAALLGTLVLAVALIAAFVAVLAEPTPRDLPVGVVRDDGPARAALAAAHQETAALRTHVYADAAAADEALLARRVAGVLTSVDLGTGGGLNLVTASGASPATAELLTTALGSAVDGTGLPLTVVDVAPVAERDPGGMVPFYLVFALIVAGVLAACALGVALGTIPPDLDRVALRTAALGIFSVALGVAGALLVGPIFQIWRGHTLGIAIAGALISFAAAMITKAVQAWLGLLGTGVVLVLLVVLGVPGSGGLVPPALLPGFFRSMVNWNPTGLGVDLVTGVAYFDRTATGWPVIALTLWALAGVAGLLAATAVLGRRAR